MSSRAVLIAACVVARDPRVDAGSVLEVWAREGGVAFNPMDRSAPLAVAAVLDDLDSQAFFGAALRGLSAGLSVGVHMGTRVNGRGEDDPVEVSVRSVEGARKLAEAAPGGHLLVSGDLGAFLSIARARLASYLEPMRVRLGDGASAEAFRLRGPTATASASRGGTAAPTTLDGGRRSQLIEQLGSALTPYLGPIAPLMLRRLPSGRMSTKDFVEAILKDVPEALYEQVKQAIDEEIRRLR